MAGEDRMEPLERLLNLVGLLLESRNPRTFDEIRDVLEPYRQENVDSAKRMFERDKDVLREFGVPLELVDLDAWGGEQGYVIRKDRYYLPEISFTPEELGALFVAAQSGSDDTTPAEQAVRKLLTGTEGGGLAVTGGGPLASRSDAPSPLLVAAADAAERRRRVRFGYRTSSGQASDRDADAYAVVFRRGHWYLVGLDHTRDDVRAFRLSRLTTELSDVGEGSEPRRASAPRTTCSRVHGRRRTRTERRSRSRPRSHGGRPPVSRTPRSRAARGRMGGGRRRVRRRGLRRRLGADLRAAGRGAFARLAPRGRDRAPGARRCLSGHAALPGRRTGSRGCW
ncbi:MAG: WYL domain-containing protein [Actinomycetota bacterium]